MDFESIYRTYFQDVYLYIWRLSGNESIAEEITSETFFRALRAIDSFRGECELRVWLCQIAKNCYFAYLKKNSRLVSLEDAQLQMLPDGQIPAEEHLAGREEAQQLRMLLHSLKEPYREVFMWRVYGELSFRQIGQIFGKSENWACVTYHRARTMLKRKMEVTEYEE